MKTENYYLWCTTTCQRHEAQAGMKFHGTSDVVRWNEPIVGIIGAGMKFQTEVALVLYGKVPPFIHFVVFFETWFY